MRILDILIDSAMMLGLTDDMEILQSVTEETEEQIIHENKNVESLFHLIKYSIRELCTNYIPVTNRVNVTIKDNQYPVAQLENYIRVNQVLKDGEVVKHKLINRNIVVQEDGEYMVEYSTYPEIITMFQEIDFLPTFNADVITLGLCAYFSLAHGMFSEFEDFHDQYTTKAENLKTLKIFDLPSRRWE